MINCPVTKEAAARCVYGGWAGAPKGTKYNPEFCAMEVGTMPHYHQCSLRPGCGPDNLYCKQHAKRFAPR